MKNLIALKRFLALHCENFLLCKWFLISSNNFHFPRSTNGKHTILHIRETF
jgi:hypothetical protein